MAWCAFVTQPLFIGSITFICNLPICTYQQAKVTYRVGLGWEGSRCEGRGEGGKRGGNERGRGLKKKKKKKE